MNYIIFFLNLLIFLFFNFSSSKSQLYIIGYIKDADGIGQIAPNIINIFEAKKNINVSLIDSRPWLSSLNYYNKFIQDIIDNKKLLSKDNVFFKKKSVSIFTDVLWCPDWKHLINLKNEGIKFAYTMTEHTKVPNEWVKKINRYFDAILVPDEYLIDVYKKSGVIKPIFALPIPIKIQEFLEFKKSTIKKPFVFGCSATFTLRKNHSLLINAFAKEFMNNKDVILKIHGRYGDYESIKQQINKLGINNIHVIKKEFSRKEYVNFMLSLDCYIFLSKGEGFSITPREALAAGIPCILSDNTTHKTVCKTGFVYPIKSDIIEHSYSDAAQKWIGYDFNCDINDVRKAMKDMIQNYNYHFDKAQQGRNWVQKYTIEKLRPRYFNLVAPKNIIFSNDNIITKNHIETNCKKLYEKYQSFVNE